MVCVTADTDRLWVYDGAAWQRVGNYSQTGRTWAWVQRTANQSIANGTLTTVTWDTVNSDADSFHSGATFTQLAVPTGLGGVYQVFGTILYGAVVTNTESYLTVNGTDLRMTAGGGNNHTFEAFSTTTLLSAAGTIALRVYQLSGGAVNFTGTLNMLRLAI